MKFLCDQMLGSLSRWLRFFGFDTYYIKKDIDDVQLLNIAEEENRILITRDKELIIRAKKRNLKNIKIDTIDLDNQLKLVLKNIKIDKDKILSRCSICNDILNKICKEDIKDRIPNKILDNMHDFYICKKCDKIYWMGSHYDKIINKINEITKG